MPDEIIDIHDFRNKFNSKAIFGIIIAILFLIAAFSSFYTVDQEEEAVVLLFGKYNRTTGPGLHFKMPFGIENNFNVPTQRILKEEFGFRTTTPGIVTTYSTGNFEAESVMLTGDLNIADVTWIIQYRIKDPYAWLFHVEDQQNTIRDISQSVINLMVGDLAVFDVVTTERTQIEQKAQDMMNIIFDRYKMGIRVVTVKLQKTMYPKGAVQDAFEDVNKAIQDRIRLINEGKEAYNNLIPKARGEAEKTLREAEGYAIEKINQAKGDVARFLAVLSEYKKNPNVTRTRLYYDTFGTVLGNSEDTDIIDKQLKNFLPIKSMAEEKQGDKK